VFNGPTTIHGWVCLKPVLDTVKKFIATSWDRTRMPNVQSLYPEIALNIGPTLMPGLLLILTDYQQYVYSVSATPLRIGIDVLMGLILYSAIFWDVTPCNLVNVCLCMGTTVLLTYFLLRLFFYLEDGGNMFS
jgi:hypothetical protein